MGSVLKNFSHGCPGAISRSLDDVVVALANKSNAPMAFGIPVALNSDKTGVIPFDANTHTAADFVGVTVRNPSKTPDIYGDNLGSYGPKDIADVIVRGHVVVRVNGTARLGMPVSILKSNGQFSTSTADTAVMLNNVHVSGAASESLAEILLNTRNML